MSHISTSKIQYRHFDCLVRAGQDCGLEFMEGQKTHKWYGRFMNDYPIPQAYLDDGRTAADLGHCEHAFRVPNNPSAYELGVYTKKDGTFGVIADWWNGGRGLQKQIGVSENDYARLEAAYCANVAVKVAQERGYYYERNGDCVTVTTPQGTVTIDGSTVEAHNFVGSACAQHVDLFASALGVVTETMVKPEYHRQNMLMQGGM